VIETRDVKVVITATIQVPCETALPTVHMTLAQGLPNVFRDVGYVPRILIEVEQTGS